MKSLLGETDNQSLPPGFLASACHQYRGTSRPSSGQIGKGLDCNNSKVTAGVESEGCSVSAHVASACKCPYTLKH